MYNLLSAQEIRKRLRMYSCLDISTKAIHYIAKKIGYKERSVGMKRGYDKSIYLALTRHLKELVDYDKSIKDKVSQKQNKQPKMQDNYYTYNGERDNIDYDWEKNESVIKKAIIESINNLEIYKN